MVDLLSKTMQLACAAAIAAASAATLVSAAAAADGKPSRSLNTKWLCSVWQSDPEQYKECLRRNR
ncbi:MAG TPA: hypothetical protein VMV26_16315 [Alphaproteobacteria bacterium]|jgi:Spy/CpxP family protein refolding chaperone|nr:hypothetical protein [Alphaproteobacteria bacterium]